MVTVGAGAMYSGGAHAPPLLRVRGGGQEGTPSITATGRFSYKIPCIFHLACSSYILHLLEESNHQRSSILTFIFLLVATAEYT